ncbi:MAG TPA: hypothetical protein VHZ95_07265, partial [Polyangiales bacterium]|nr:hypothetical protein [Polyangiales bacterium]
MRHRPLPSVDIALLPHELRAIRMQRRALIGGALSLILVVLGLAYGKALVAHFRVAREPQPVEANASEPSPSTNTATSTLAATSLEAASPPRKMPVVVSPTRRMPPPSIDPQRSVPPPPPIHLTEPISTTSAGDDGDGPKSRIEAKFGGAKSFHQALLLSGASPEEANELIAALGKLVDFRRGKPDDRLVFEREPDKQLRAFEYRASVTEIYRAVRNEAGAMRGLRVDVPIERKRIAKGIYIAGSLGHSLSALGLGPQLAGTVTEAFGSRISFTKDTRTGDSVKLIVDEEYVDGSFLRYGNVHAIEYASERAGKLQAFWFEDQPGDGDYYDANGR